MQYKNTTKPDPNATVMFIDMNSFFASCEQQDDVSIRGKPIGVCGAGANSVIIAPSIEAKARGVKTGMRVREAKEICPELIPVQVSSDRYRKYHVAIMDVLRSYSEDVIPKSIDEAVVNLSAYRLVYPDSKKLAQQIKHDIQTKVGDWLKCSIGIAPNTFLAKLATDLQKPDGLVQITQENIDSILEKLELTDLPGIADNWAKRLIRAGIRTPVQMRHTSPEVLKKIMGGVIGYYWHYRLNFAEVDFYTNEYKSMSAVRTLSSAQRTSPALLQDILLSLCMRLENRLVQHHLFCRYVTFYCSYQNRTKWDISSQLEHPMQDGTDMYQLLIRKITQYEKEHKVKIFTSELRTLGVAIKNFIEDKHVQYELFDNNLRRDKLRRTVYDIKNKFGKKTIIKAVELREEEVVKDIIGFGSVKDMYKA